MRVMTLYCKLPCKLPPCPLEEEEGSGSDSEWEDIEEEDGDWIQFSDDKTDAPAKEEEDQVDGAVLSKPSTSKRRKVQFREKDLVQVHEVEENADWKDYRKLFWELCAVDRCRFRERVLRTERELGNIFSPEHREKVFKTRVSPYLKEQEEGAKFNASDNDIDQDENRMDIQSSASVGPSNK